MFFFLPFSLFWFCSCFFPTILILLSSVFSLQHRFRCPNALNCCLACIYWILNIGYPNQRYRDHHTKNSVAFTQTFFGWFLKHFLPFMTKALSYNFIYDDMLVISPTPTPHRDARERRKSCACYTRVGRSFVIRQLLQVHHDPVIRGAALSFR